MGFDGVFFSQFDERKTNNIGDEFEPDAGGKGYATELSRRAIRFGFDEIGLDEVVWGVREDHVTSRKDWNNQGYNFKKDGRL
ncbi:GNAT family N-acetyltransferase [Pantoea eucalypti]|uniref:GNAT family N-acetyltransferase n=1 Tax=Pantoea eucalypti TaxID=470933 RepID=UPI001EE33E69|nr:GNAT family N-acetyltransferase [Pantoea eucalypti]